MKKKLTSALSHSIHSPSLTGTDDRKAGDAKMKGGKERKEKRKVKKSHRRLRCKKQLGL
jgi:hypothetical protein